VGRTIQLAVRDDGRGDPPGPGTIETTVVATRFRRDPLGESFAMIRRYGDVICSRFGPWRFYSLFRPEHVRHVLQDNNHNYVKGELIERTKILIGDGLFSTEGDVWRRQRRTVQPAFDRRRITSLIPVITESAATTLDRWAPDVDAHRPIDLPTAMTALTLHVIGHAFFGVDVRAAGVEIADPLRVALAFVNRRVMVLFPAPMTLPFPAHVRFRRARRVLDSAVTRIIDERRRHPNAGNRDLLSLLLTAYDPETGEGLTDAEIRDQVMTFVLAGHETTALALTWALLLLAAHPDVEERLQREVRAVLHGRPPTAEDLPRLPYARMVLDETLRLYPPVWAVAREAIADDEIGGYRIRAGAGLAVNTYVTHHHPEIWPDPTRFDPERFAPSATATRARFAYFPFGGGPRQCVGSEFALTEAQLVLAMTVDRYRIATVSAGAMHPEISLTLRPRRDIRVTLERTTETQ